MRLLLLCAVPLALAACNETPPVDPAATPSAPATIATTNATVEPVPGATASGTPSASNTPMPGNSTPIPANAPPSACGADKAARFVGKNATPETRAQVIEAVGHNRIRWIGPDTAVTADYSEARLNADLSATDRIERFRCG